MYISKEQDLKGNSNHEIFGKRYYNFEAIQVTNRIFSPAKTSNIEIIGSECSYLKKGEIEDKVKEDTIENNQYHF
jgi:hypothetical protein